MAIWTTVTAINIPKTVNPLIGTMQYLITRGPLSQMHEKHNNGMPTNSEHSSLTCNNTRAVHQH